MPPTSDDLAVLDQLAEEFVGRLRRGERPPIQPYAQQNPHLAADIERLFPTLVAMEQLGSSTEPTSSARTAIELPQRIGDYRIIRLIGEGGMGLVYEAIEESLGRHVALKVLPTHGLMSDRFRERFKREARAAGRLHHPHIVPVFGVGEDRGTHYYAMQYIPGRGLDAIHNPGPRPTPVHGFETVTLIASADTDEDPRTTPAIAPRQSPKTGSDHFQWVAQVGAQVADALAYAHEEGVIHRDVKPSNLILDDNGAVWVTDFGLAKTTESDGLTASGDIVGTIRYMAPERFNGWSDARSDVYGLGATLFELLTGRPMFDDPDRGKLIHAILNSDPPRPRKLNRAVPRDLETIVLKATTREPGHRYQSAQALGNDLRRFLAGLPVQARRHSWIGYAWRACKRRPSTAITAALLAISVLALLVGSIVVNIRLDDRAAKIESAQQALVIQLQETDAARTREAETRVEVRQHLMRSLRRDASAPRWTRRSGSPGHAYATVRALTDRSKEFPLSADEIQVLRNLVIAASAQIDIVPEQYTGPALPADSLFSPDLSHYAAVTKSPDRSVRVREYSTGSEIARLKVFSDVSSYAFSPDGKVFVVRDGRRGLSPEPHTMVIWNWQENKIVAEIRGRFDGTPWAISPDSTELALAHPGGAVDFYTLADGTKRRRVETKSNIYGMGYHPAGTKLATFQRISSRIDIRDVVGGKIVMSVTTPAGAHVMGLGWSADGTMLAAGCSNFRGCVWHMENGQLACELLGHNAEVTNCMFDPNGQWLATTGWDKTTHFWHPVTGQALLDPLMGMINAISADGRRIGYHTKHDSGTWSVTQPRELLTLHGHTGGKGPWHVSFGMGGRVMVTSSVDAIRFWEPTTGRAVGALRPPGGAMTALFTPDDKQLFAAGHEHCTRWPSRFDADANTLVIGRPEALLPHQAGRTERRASLSADGARAAISNQSRGLMYVFPLDDPALWRSYGTVTELGNAQLSPDGKWVIGTSWPTPSARVWNTVTNQKVMDFPVQSPVGVAFSPDGEHVVLGSVLKGEVRKVGSWEHVRDIPVNSFGPAFVHAAYSPDGRILAACRSSHRAVHLLDARTFEEFARLEAPDPQPVHCLAFSPDGSRLVVNCGTRVVQMWNLRAIRERLAPFGLDWDQPPYGPEMVVEQRLQVVIESQGK